MVQCHIQWTNIKRRRMNLRSSELDQKTILEFIDKVFTFLINPQKCSNSKSWFWTSHFCWRHFECLTKTRNITLSVTNVNDVLLSFFRGGCSIKQGNILANTLFNQCCVGHTAWAPKGREGQSQADPKGPMPGVRPGVHPCLLPGVCLGFGRTRSRAISTLGLTVCRFHLFKISMSHCSKVWFYFVAQIYCFLSFSEKLFSCSEFLCLIVLKCGFIL